MARGEEKLSWYKLDNAGVLYSALQREEYSAVYRFSALMTQPVDPDVLQRAIERTMPRFPSFGVRIKRGFFWYYFEPNKAPGPFLKQDIANPCQPIRFQEDNGWLVRFYCGRRRISVEVFHALSDGAGTLTFFRTLLAVYLREMGYQIPDGPGILDVEAPPTREEREDAYARYASGKSFRGGWEKTAYSNTGTAEPFYTLNMVMGSVPLDRLREVAHRYRASVTEYLAGVLIRAILDNQRAERRHRERPVALAVPINLRAYFPSETLRNFILTARPVIDPTLGEYSLEEIVSQVHHYMRLHITRQEMQAKLTGNVRFQQNRLLQLIPGFLKNPIMSFAYWLVGTRPYSATYTNPGAFPVPEEMAPHIQRMEVVLGQATSPRPTCASMSYGNTMTITFAGTQIEPDTERRFFRLLVQEGIPVKIESNREG